MKRVKILTLLIFSILSVITMPARAILNLELTKGMRAAIPIGVVPFDNEGQALAPGNVAISQIIQNDLQNSGEFAVKTLTNNSQDWRGQSVNDVIKGSVTAVGGGRYQVSFQVVGVYNQGQALIANSVTVPKEGLRKVAHHISDMIFEKLTGVPGVFSTKVAYILVQHQMKPVRYTLEVSDMDGFNPHPLLTSGQPIMSPSWSPNGRQIAYVSFEGERAAIYIQNLASGQRELVAHYPGINGAPAFSPDGSKLAMVLTLSGNPKVYVMNLSSRKLTQITQGYSIDTEPSWSHDGRSLIFTSSVGANPQIFRYDFATGQPTRITFSGNYNARASFLPDQQGIVMMHRDGGDGASFGIAREDLGNGRVQVLTEAGSDDSPSLAPNGKMVIYASQADGRGVLGIVSIDGGIKIRLPAREGDVQEPAWSPFLG